jgi:hypothetical protein
MHYIGDTDMKTMKRYLKWGDDRLRAVADTWTTGWQSGLGQPAENATGLPVTQKPANHSGPTTSR